MATTTNYGWTTPDDTALVKDGAAAIRTLGSSVDTTTKALNPSTTLGDIEYRSSTANTNTRLGIGTTGQVLSVSGGVPAWATPAAGGGLTLLSTTALSGSSTTVSSISGSYKNLRVVILSARNSQGSNFSIRLNGDTSNNYGRQLFAMQSGTQANEVATGAASINIGTIDSSTNFYDMANVFLDFPNYTNALDKVIRVSSVSKGGGTIYSKTGIAVYDTSSAITSIEFFPGDGGTFSAGDILIYGEN
jgi:hypothetical protein